MFADDEDDLFNAIEDPSMTSNDTRTGWVDFDSSFYHAILIGLYFL